MRYKLHKLRNATGRLRSGRLLDLPDALSVQQQLESVAEAASSSAIVAGWLLAQGSFPAALLDLLTAAVRLDARSCSDACGLTLEAHGKLYWLASEAVSALVCFPPEDCPPPKALDFATRLVQTRTLHCYSRLLAAATEDVQAAGAPATQYAADIIGGAGRFVGALAEAAERGITDAASADTPGAAAGSSRARQPHPHQQQQRRALAFADELAAALHDSGVAEHLARAALHLYLHLEQPAEASDEGAIPAPPVTGPLVYTALVACSRLMSLHIVYCKAAPANGRAVTSLRDVLGGRCVRHLALSSALAALCAADGGPSYGLPEKLLLGLPVIDNDSRQPVDLRQRQGVQQLCCMPFSLVINYLYPLFFPEASLPPPPGRRAAVALLLRLGRLAVESGRAWAEADAGAALVVAEGGGGEASNSAGQPPLGGGSGGGGCGSEGASRVPGVPGGICSGSSGRVNQGCSSSTNGGGSGDSGTTGGGGGSGPGGSEGGGECGGGSSNNAGGGSSGGSGDTVTTAGPSVSSGVLLSQPLRLLVPRARVAEIGGQSLALACYIFVQLHKEQQVLAASAAGAAVEGAGAARAGWQDEAAAEWWRLAVAAALHLPRWASADQLAKLPEQVFVQGLNIGYLSLDAPLPTAQPPPWTAAALAAGVLPCFERLLRRAGEAPEVAEAALALSLAEDCMGLDMLAPLLAYGEPRQAAALVATVRKLLASRAPADLLLAACTGGTACPSALGFTLNLLNVVQEWTLRGAEHYAIWQQPGELSAGQAAAVGAAASGPGRQLAQVVSYAASEWLPPLSRLFEAVEPLLAGGGDMGGNFLSICLKSLMQWLHVLARCGALEQGAVAVLAAAGGWRRWLLEEMRVVPLLGSALGLLPLLLHQRAQEAPDVGFPLGRLLGESCCCVAAAFPNEVRGAAMTAAAAEERVANGAAGPSRPDTVGRGSLNHSAGDCSGTPAGASSSGSNPSGQDEPASWARAAAASGPGGWRPSLLRALAAELRAHGDVGDATVAAAVADLARWLEASCAGGSGGAGGDKPMVREGGNGVCIRCGGVHGLPAFAPAWDERASGLRIPALAEARALLRTCANPACGNLAGGSEAELPLRACGRCGAAWYCGRECQTAHWRTGHREACGRQAPGGRAAGGLEAL